MEWQRIVYAFKRKTALGFIILSVITTIILAYLFDAQIQGSNLGVCKFVTSVSGTVVNSESGICNTPAIQVSIMEVFYLIWGLTITFVIFFVEFGNTYWCGVTLKTIIELSLNQGFLAAGAFLYISLCPLIYVFAVQNKWIACLWGIICTFTLFCSILAYIIFKIRKKQIVKLLKNSTKDKIWKAVHKKDKNKKSLQGTIEGLPIVDMIRHVDYSDADEVAELIRTLTKMIKKKHNIVSLTKDTNYARVTIMLWVACIIEASGMKNIIERERTAYIIKKFWEDISEEIDNNKYIQEKEKVKMCYTIEILLPFIKLGTEEAAEVLRSLWTHMVFEREKIILYLLFYEEHLHAKRLQWKKNYCITTNTLNIHQRRLSVAAKAWNQAIAWEFWRNWMLLEEEGNNRGFTLCLDFCNGVKLISEGKTQGIQSYILKKYCLEMEGNR